MDIRIKHVTVAISIFILLFNSGCHKFLCTRHYYSFSIDTTLLYPLKDSIAVGDTIYFLSRTSTHLKDLSTGQSIDYSKSVNFGTAIGATELSMPNTQRGAVDDFKWIPIRGKVFTDNSIPSSDVVKQGIFAEENGQYILAFAIVPTRRGIFSLSVADMPDVVKDCDHAGITMKLTTTDNHLHYLKETYYGGGPIASIDSTHIYCFKVY